MPTVSVFYGITVRMYYDEHPPPHFHAYYAEHAAVIEIATLRVLRGSIPRRAMSLVLEWGFQYRDGLRSNWDRAFAHEPLHSIPPLE